MYRLLVTGGRDAPEAEVVWISLWLMLHKQQAMIVMHGAAPSGVDLYAHEWFGLPEQAFNRERRRYEDDLDYFALEDPHPAQWRRLGKGAGMVRNQEMIDAAPDVCFAFPTPRSSGTLDCMARAWVRGVPVLVWDYLQPARYHRLADDEGEKLARRRLRWPSVV